jgi:hypothetical protein
MTFKVFSMVQPINRNPVVIDSMMVSIQGFCQEIIEFVNLAKSKLRGGHRHHIRELCESVEAIGELIEDVSPHLVGKWVTAYVQSERDPLQLLTTHEIRIVSKIFTVVCRRMCFTVNNILFIDRAQMTVTALAEIMDFARTHHSNDPVGWTNVIEDLQKILTIKDMRRLVLREDNTYPPQGFENEDCDVYRTWKASFVGVETYHRIMRGVTGYFPPILVDDHPVWRDHNEEEEEGEGWYEDPDVV